MDTAQIARLLEPFLEAPLDPRQLEQISTYIDLLLRWNRRINLTAIRKEEEIVPRHFGESLFLARHLFPATNSGIPADPVILSGASASPSEALAESKDPYPVPTANREPRTANSVLDLGSGAGFPALPLKIWSPGIPLTLVESNHKKAAFLRETARALTLTNINVINARAEALDAAVDADADPGPGAGPAFPRSQVVTLRAVESFQSILPVAARLLAPGGTLALLIGASQLPHLSALPTVQWHPPIPIPQSRERVLSIGIL